LFLKLDEVGADLLIADHVRLDAVEEGRELVAGDGHVLPLALRTRQHKVHLGPPALQPRVAFNASALRPVIQAQNLTEALDDDVLAVVILRYQHSPTMEGHLDDRCLFGACGGGGHGRYFSSDAVMTSLISRSCCAQ